MLSKMDDFNLSLIYVASFVLHNKLKYNLNKTTLNLKFKKLANNLKINPEQIEYAFIYLKNQGIIYNNENFFDVNLILLQNLLKKFLKTESPKNVIIIQPNFEIIAKPNIALKDLFYLAQFSILKEKDVVYKFKITEDSLWKAFCSSWSDKKILNLLSNLTDKQLPENILFTIKEVYKRKAEILLGKIGYFIIAKKFLIQQLEKDAEFKKLILKKISPSLLLLDNTIPIIDIYYKLRQKNFFPELLTEKISKINNEFILKLNNEEIENLYSAIITLKEIAVEHKISVQYNILNNLINKLDKIIQNNIKSNAVKNSIIYQTELKNSIKQNILKTLKSYIKIPAYASPNKISEEYKGENPAQKLNDMKSLLNFAIIHKMLVVIKLKPSYKNEGEEYLAEPRYIYKDKVYAYIKNLKLEKSFKFKDINFIMLPT